MNEIGDPMDVLDPNYEWIDATTEGDFLLGVLRFVRGPRKYWEETTTPDDEKHNIRVFRRCDSGGGK